LGQLVARAGGEFVAVGVCCFAVIGHGLITPLVSFRLVSGGNLAGRKGAWRSAPRMSPEAFGLSSFISLRRAHRRNELTRCHRAHVSNTNPVA
ncbi:MAG: hypothetical protein U1C47_21510, partial [Hydrogenophaga sp.]|nr:hypothetical protein [Hydrogenophaga sp.]